MSKKTILVYSRVCSAENENSVNIDFNCVDKNPLRRFKKSSLVFHRKKVRFRTILVNVDRSVPLKGNKEFLCCSDVSKKLQYPLCNFTKSGIAICFRSNWFCNEAVIHKLPEAL